jgi:uncharacterized protein YbgA (DUF1722 family)/uncharacterized protein YbbK (DUF523 family)
LREFVKPQVVISKCLGFAKCRYNGLTIPDDFVTNLKPHVEFNIVCPEVEIGLGIPRDPIRIVSVKKKLHLVQPATGKDLTEEMTDFSASFLNSLKTADGFILKNRSPSCGIKDVKVYPGTGKVASIARDSGFFGAAVRERFPYSAIEDEGRLKNYRIREHFLTKLFTLANFRRCLSSQSLKELNQFHSENKELFMMYNEQELRVLNRLVSNHEMRSEEEVIKLYEQNLHNTLKYAPRYTSVINVLLHIFSFFSKALTHQEKALFLDSLLKYRDGAMSLCSITTLMKSWIMRFENEQLMNQTFFEPYPEELVVCFLLTEPEKNRDS